MKSNMTLALAANTWANRFNPGAVAAARMRYLPMSDGAVLVASEAVLQEAREVYAEQSAALAKLRAMAEPVVTPDEEPDFLANVKAAFNREDSASFHEPDMDHAEPHDTPGQRVIPAPGTAKVEEERAEWDRQHDGDRFE